ncbi:MAG: hypothetical protein Q7S52_00125 [bacterium]|nr:hypothetical protein [bacterium]
MNNYKVSRLLLSTALFASALLGPFSLTLALMVFGFLYFPRYAEPVAAALLVELLYRGEGGGMFEAPMLFTLVIFCIFMAVESLRMFIRTRTR